MPCKPQINQPPPPGLTRGGVINPTFAYLHPHCLTSQEDLRDLGLGMVERRRVLRWAASTEPSLGPVRSIRSV